MPKYGTSHGPQANLVKTFNIVQCLKIVTLLHGYPEMPYYLTAECSDAVTQINDPRRKRTRYCEFDRLRDYLGILRRKQRGIYPQGIKKRFILWEIQLEGVRLGLVRGETKSGHQRGV